MVYLWLRFNENQRRHHTYVPLCLNSSYLSNTRDGCVVIYVCELVFVRYVPFSTSNSVKMTSFARIYPFINTFSDLALLSGSETSIIYRTCFCVVNACVVNALKS